MEEEIKNEEPKQKSHKVFAIVIIVIACALIFGSGIILGQKLFEGNKENKNTSKDTNTIENNNTINDNTNDNQNLSFDDNKKNKIDEFMKLAMTEQYDGSGFPDEFVKGKKGLTKEQKELLTYFAVATDDNMKELTINTIPNKYKDDEYFKYIDGVSFRIYELSLQLFLDKYRELFNEEYIIESEDNGFGGCPFVFKIDKELGKMFLSNQCGGTSDGEWDYLYLNYKYETDKDYYYVYQYNGYYIYEYEGNHIDFKKSKSEETVFTVPITKNERIDFNKLKEQFELNASKFETIVWKFDKNLNFVSTENKG